MKNYVSSGIEQLDTLLGGGVMIGDNVVWYDTAGTLAPVFMSNFVRISREEKKELIYISFDRSPRSVLEKLGPLGENKRLTILDCFTHGKGESSGTFLSFYENDAKKLPCRIIKEEDPFNPDQVKNNVYGIHEKMSGDVRLIFDSLTGMQELWGDEEIALRFYAQSCPRLYELNTEAYWIVESEAHTSRFRAHLNKVTQVAIGLSLKRGKTSLTLIKAEGRDLGTLEIPVEYWSEDLDVSFNLGGSKPRKTALGAHLKQLRTRKGLSQAALARLVGVTPSTISQVESDQIYPSVTALLKMADILGVEIGALFGEAVRPSSGKIVYPLEEASDVALPEHSEEGLLAKLFTSDGSQRNIESYVLEIPANTRLDSHFFKSKDVEIGYLLSGVLKIKADGNWKYVPHGSFLDLSSEIPEGWENPGETSARLLWVRVQGQSGPREAS